MKKKKRKSEHYNTKYFNIQTHTHIMENFIQAFYFIFLFFLKISIQAASKVLDDQRK